VQYIEMKFQNKICQ